MNHEHDHQTQQHNHEHSHDYGHDHQLPCKDNLTNLNAYIYGELDNALCRDIETHIKSCPNCRIVVNTLKKTIQLYQMDGQETTLPDEARHRLMTRLDLDDYVAKE
jgi:anti-sigma factor RsiW